MAESYDLSYDKNTRASISGVPFIGDALDSSNNSFYRVATKQFSIQSLRVGASKFYADLGINAIDVKTIPQQFDFIIVAVELKVPLSSKMKSTIEQCKRFSAGDEINGGIDVRISAKQSFDSTHIKDITMGGVVTFKVLPRKYAENLSSSFALLFLQNKYSINYSEKNLKQYIEDVRNIIPKSGSPFVTDKDEDLFEDYTSTLNQLKHEVVSLEQSCTEITDLFHGIQCYMFIIENIVDIMTRLESISQALDSVKEHYEEKSSLINIFEANEVSYMNTKDFHDYEAKTDNNGDRLFLMMTDKFSSTDFKEAYNFLLSVKNQLATKRNWKCSIVDLDVKNDRVADIPLKPVIRHYANGGLICDDVVANLSDDTKNNFIKFSTDGDKTSDCKERSLLLVPCPVCPNLLNKKLYWTCDTCRSRVEYHHNRQLWCKCGSHNLTKIDFRCHNYFHKDFVTSSDVANDNELKNLKLLKPITMLLIGQSGVGKTTWINALANYVLYPDLDTALKAQPVILVPGKFTMHDKEQNEHVVVLGNDDNECTTVGESCTQNCREYVIYHEDYRLSLIDTPGMGDTRGYEQDTENLRIILRYLKSFPSIHAVCFLLKPNETRANANVRYILKEIMCYLHQSVKKNLIFAFTNARSTMYRTGETFPILEKMMEDARQKYSLSRQKMYHFDNESFRFLCASTMSTMKFVDDEKELYEQSWIKSWDETKRLMRIVSQLQPYETENSLNIGYVRFKLHSAITRVVESSIIESEESVNEQIADYERKKELLENHRSSTVKGLMEVTARPRIVCTNPSCCVIEGGATHYKICMLDCLVSRNFRALPNSELRKAPILSRVNCTNCNCRWEKHMIIDFDQIMGDVPKDNAAIIAEIDNVDGVLSKLNEKLEAIQEGTYSVDKVNLQNFIELLAKFLAQHSFFLSNDAIEEYLDLLIHSMDLKPDKTELEYVRLKALKTDKKKVQETCQAVSKFENINFVQSPHLKYMDLDAIKEMEENFKLNLPNDLF